MRDPESSPRTGGAEWHGHGVVWPCPRQSRTQPSCPENRQRVEPWHDSIAPSGKTIVLLSAFDDSTRLRPDGDRNKVPSALASSPPSPHSAATRLALRRLPHPEGTMTRSRPTIRSAGAAGAPGVSIELRGTADRAAAQEKRPNIHRLLSGTFPAACCGFYGGGEVGPHFDVLVAHGVSGKGRKTRFTIPTVPCATVARGCWPVPSPFPLHGFVENCSQLESVTMEFPMHARAVLRAYARVQERAARSCWPSRPRWWSGWRRRSLRLRGALSGARFGDGDGARGRDWPRARPSARRVPKRLHALLAPGTARRTAVPSADAGARRPAREGRALRGRRRAHALARAPIGRDRRAAASCTSKARTAPTIPRSRPACARHRPRHLPDRFA